MLKVYTLKSLGKAQGRSVLALAFPGCLASLNGWMSFCFFKLLPLTIAPPPIISAGIVFRLSWSQLRTLNNISAMLPTAHWKLPSWSLGFKFQSKKREGERENLTHPVQASKPRHPGYRSLESLWKALLRPGVSTVTFQANVTGGVSKLLSH